MEDRQRVFIRDVEGRGDEVRQALIDLGGKVYRYYSYNVPGCLYFINHDGEIKCTEETAEMGKIIMDNYREIKLPEQIWKDGDVLVNIRFNECFAICKSVCNTGEDAYRCYIFADCGCDGLDVKGGDILRSAYRLAAPSEVENFHELLHKHQKDWDAEKKQLVDWKWKPKDGDTVYYFDEIGQILSDSYDDFSNGALSDFGNVFRTREEAEAMAEKVKKLLKGI